MPPDNSGHFVAVARTRPSCRALATSLTDNPAGEAGREKKAQRTVYTCIIYYILYMYIYYIRALFIQALRRIIQKLNISKILQYNILLLQYYNTIQEVNCIEIGPIYYVFSIYTLLYIIYTLL